MDKSLSNLNKYRALAGVPVKYADEVKRPGSVKKITEAAGMGPKGAIEHVWIVQNATPESELHDVMNLTDVKGMVHQIKGMADATSIALFPEGAKAAALAEAKARLEAANAPAPEADDVASVAEMDMENEEDLDVPADEKPSFDLMDTSDEPTGEICEDCGCDPCECEDKEEAMKDDLSEAAADESATAPGKTGVNAQTEVGHVFKGAWKDKSDEPLTNQSDEGDSHYDARSLYPMDAKRQTDSEENEEKVTIPTNIKSALSERIKELEDKIEEKWWHDEGTALMHGRAAHWMKEILEHLDGTKEGFKWAQIEYSKAMGPIQQLMPDDVRSWIVRGGRAASLKDFMTVARDRSW